MAQFGSALDWGSRGREFKSRYSDQNSRAVSSYEPVREYFFAVLRFLNLLP